MTWEGAFPLGTFSRVCKSGETHRFEARADPVGDGTAWLYRVKPLPAGEQSDKEYFASLKLVEAGLLQIEFMSNDLPDHYQGCGITSALLPLIANDLSAKIRSSRHRPADEETHTTAARAVWQRMVVEKAAWYDATEDRFYYPAARSLLPLPLETTRLIVREFEPSDRAAIEALYGDREVIDYVGTSPFAPRPGETPEIAFRRVRLSAGRPVALAAHTGALTGALSLLAYVDENGAAPPGDFEITISLVEDARSKRVGSEALSVVLDALQGVPEVRRVITRVAPGREASLHLVKGRHFTRIGERNNPYLKQRDIVFALEIKRG
jgi:RimJ/RimL family protein N-acetyltransferase